MTTRLSKYWPSILFCASLVTVVLLLTISFGSGWCKSDETPVPCVREWVDASGSIFAVVAASIAAMIAYRQSQAAKIQNKLSQITIIEDQLRAAHQLLKVASDGALASGHCSWALSHLVAFLEDRDFDPVPEFHSYCAAVVACRNDFREFRIKREAIEERHSHHRFITDATLTMDMAAMRLQMAVPYSAVMSNIARIDLDEYSMIINEAVHLMQFEDLLRRNADELSEVSERLKVVRDDIQSEIEKLHTQKKNIQALVS